MESYIQTTLELDTTDMYLNDSPLYTPVKAEAHTPPYKIHKYFARRPWNVFNQLVQKFSEKNEIILDPFCGGGVTVYEGLKHDRKIIGCDLNPLSIFIVKNMVKKLSNPAKLYQVFELTENYIQTLYTNFDTFKFEKSNIKIEWSEVAFKVKCKYCQSNITLSNENRIRNGVYKCDNALCTSNDKDLTGVEVWLCERNGSKYLYNVGRDFDGKKLVKNFDESDEEMLNKHLVFLRTQIKKKKIKIPKDKIPLDWDRQFEDQLAKKGILTFQDLFTERNLLINLLILDFIQSQKDKLSESEYELLRIVFSNVVKDDNIMSFTNDTWQSGKPTTWSKHAYWIPSQYCEVNVADVFRKAKQRVISLINYNKEFGFISKEVNNYKDLLKEKGNILLWNKSVVDLNLPANSIDAVITDPPYGSNVQYLELSQFWYPWNKDLYNVEPDFKSEAVSNRKKNFKGAKSMLDYENNLFRVFKKVFIALKPERYMVLTFNNKNINAWLALLFSIFRAGFSLEKDGIYFQDGVKNYKQTAHTKYDGSPYGDFIYVFKKSKDSSNGKMFKNETLFWEELDKIFNTYKKNLSTDRNNLIKSMFLEAIPLIEAFAKNYLDKNDHKLFSILKKDYFEHLYE